MKKALVIGKVWPEPQSSAAGLRMMHLLQALKKICEEVHFASTAHPTDFSEDLAPLSIHTKLIELNNSSFDEFIKSLKPDLVLFDRFTSEEQFGWRVADFCPNAIRILNTEDLHGLRHARETANKKNRSLQLADLHSDICRREIAAIYRCDLSLIISKKEMQILREDFNVPEFLLHYLPLPASDLSEQDVQSLPEFSERQHFMSIGNFLHAPNRDSVTWLRNQIWPSIRKQLPSSEMHVYGAYCDEKIKQLEDKKSGFLVKGRADNAALVMKQARVCLAPLRFGAGQKGKLLLAMECGTPSVTTPTGAESMHEQMDWPGCIADDEQSISEAAVKLYSDEKKWQLAQDCGFKIIATHFNTKIHESGFVNKVLGLSENLNALRLRNFTGYLLQQQSMQSTKYMALWIEEKNRK